MPKVALVMGSGSDLPVLESALNRLESFGIEAEVRIISAHRTPDEAAAFARSAAANGIDVILAAAGKAAHLPGVLAAFTTLPVIGIPIKSSFMDGLDSLLSIVQMPKGVPVATFAIGEAGAANAALHLIATLAGTDAGLRKKLVAFRARQTQAARDMKVPPEA